MSATAFTIYQRSLFAPLPSITWSANDTNWANAPALAQSIADKECLYEINKLRPLSRFSTQSSALAASLLYLSIEQHLFLPFDKSRVALTVGTFFRTPSFEWRDGDRRLRCATCHDELLISTYNAAAALTQMAALILGRPDLSEHSTKCCISLFNHAELLLVLLKGQMLRQADPSIRESEVLSSERLDLAIDVVHAQLCELWIQVYETRSQFAQAIQAALTACLLHEKIYERLAKDEETFSVAPGFARRLSAVKRYYYRLSIVDMRTEMGLYEQPDTFPFALVQNSITQTRSSLTKVKAPLEYVSQTLELELKRQEEAYQPGELVKDSYAAAQSWLTIQTEGAGAPFVAQGSVMDHPSMVPAGWKELVDEQEKLTHNLFALTGPYTYCLTDGQKWGDALCIQEKWLPALDRALMSGRVRTSSAPPPSDDMGLAKEFPEKSHAIKRVERLGKIMAAMNKRFEGKDRTRPPLLTLWRQVQDYIRVVSTVAFCVEQPQIGAKEVLSIAAKMATYELQMALSNKTDIASRLVSNEMIQNVLAPVEELESMIHAEITLLRDNIDVLPFSGS